MSDRAVAAATRFAGLFGVWLVVTGPGAKPLDHAAGVVTAAAATALSLRLLPPLPGRAHLLPAAWFALRFLAQSVVAGIDVARRAFDPRLPLRPGFVAFRTTLPAGTPRAVFATLMGLVPGTLPATTEPDGTLRVHCLDVGQPVAASLAREESLLRRALGTWLPPR